MSYRKKYIDLLQSCKYPMPSKIGLHEVHHINQNRDDNNWSNLVLLPKKLHSDYHLAKSRFDLCGGTLKELLKIQKAYSKKIDAENTKALNTGDFSEVWKYQGKQQAISFQISYVKPYEDIKKLVDAEIKKQHSFISKNHTF